MNARIRPQLLSISGLPVATGGTERRADLLLAAELGVELWRPAQVVFAFAGLDTGSLRRSYVNSSVTPLGSSTNNCASVVAGGCCSRNGQSEALEPNALRDITRAPQAKRDRSTPSRARGLRSGASARPPP